MAHTATPSFSQGDPVLDPYPSFGWCIADYGEYSFAGRPIDGSRLPCFWARVDWTETPEAHVLKQSLSGVTNEEMNVEMLDGKTLSISGGLYIEKRNETDFSSLSISGQRYIEKRNETDSLQCVDSVEHSSSKFFRQFGLPRMCMIEEVSAKVEDGVLTIMVPKLKKDKAKEKAIDEA